MASALYSSSDATPSAETAEESSPEPLLPSKVSRAGIRQVGFLGVAEEAVAAVQDEVPVAQDAVVPAQVAEDDGASKSLLQLFDPTDSFVKDLTGQDLKTEDSVRPPFAFSQSMLPLGLANPSLDVSIRSRLVAREASLGGSLALIAIALPHGSLPGVLLVKGQGIQQAADPSYSIPACVVGAASEGEDAQDGQDGTQEEPLLPSGSSDEGSVAESSSSSSSSGDGSVVDPEMLSNYTLAELHYQRIGCIQDLAIYHREVSNVHQYGREGCFQTRHTDRHSLRKNVARGIAQNQEACARERRLVVLQEDLQQVERALQLRGGLEPGYMEEFLATKSPSQLFNRHFELWKYYNAVMQRKTDLQFSLGSMDGPYTFQVPPEDVAETRVTLVKAITEADSICGRVSLEMLALEAFMYK